MEYCDLGDLNKFFDKYCRKLDTIKKAQIMKQIAEGIAFLHLNDIVAQRYQACKYLNENKPWSCGGKAGGFWPVQIA